MKITLEIKKTLEQNAQTYFEKAKKSRKKLEGARKALERSLKRLDEEKQIGEKKKEDIKKTKPRRKKAWYEKFRWFRTSEGFLAIGGRDATTNEVIIKKHTDKDDVVCHTDMAGSPFFVIKSEGRKIGEESIQEAIDATFCFSRAWKLGLGTADVFWVTPEQVSKEAQSGEYLPKGAFMIRGKTNYVSPSCDLAIGVMEDGSVMCGPRIAVKEHVRDILRIKKGNKKASDVAKAIKKKLGGELDDIIAALPPGNCETG